MEGTRLDRPAEPSDDSTSTLGEPGAYHAEERERRIIPGMMLGGRYRIVHVLGRGGMGEVYRADDLLLDQAVALKFLKSAGKPAWLERLRQEVRVARQITHPNVCRVFDLVKADGFAFLSMEHIDGENLAKLLQRVGRLPPERAVVIGIQICRGLAAVHEAGVLHRDLKPANLMIDGYGQARVTDFGLAAAVGSVRATEITHGTPSYMAPEQRAGREVTVRSDLYALGLVLYELMTGVRVAKPRGSPSSSEEALRPPSELVDGLHPAVDRILLRCLAREPAQRPQRASDVVTALGEGAPPAFEPAPDKAVPRRPNWVLRRKLGEGGFGEVWLAVHRETTGHRRTAEGRVFKFCREAHHLDALKREITLYRLLREELGEREDFVRILDWNFEQPPYFLEAEHTPGGNLLEWLEEQGGTERVPITVRLEIVAQIADALAAAHSVGVLHKDVKPGNVLLHGTPGRPKIRLTDFGVGRLLDETRLAARGITRMGLTRTEMSSSTSAGTPLYRAPEIDEGKAATVQADIYALGVLLYQVAVGDLRRALGPGWERDVDDDVLRTDVAAAVDRSPRHRLADAGAFATRLRSLEERRVERAAEHRRREEAERQRQALERSQLRRRRMAVVLGVTLFVTALVAYQARRFAEEAARRRNMTRVAVAGEWLERDPTRAALVLLDVEHPAAVPYAVGRMRAALRHKLALIELRHDARVASTAWHPTEEVLLTAAEDGIVHLSRLRIGRERVSLAEQRELRGCDSVLTSALWSPEGQRILVTCWDGTARILSPEPPGTPPRVLEGHENAVLAAAWSPDGRRLATASEDTAARVWDADGAGSTLRLAGHEGPITALAWSPDGRRLATASVDGSARIWRCNEGVDPEPVELFVARHEKRVWQVAWSPDGQRFATVSNDALVKIWRLEDGRVNDTPIVLEGHGTDVRMVVWSSDGIQLMTGSRDRTVRLWPAQPVQDRPPVVLTGHDSSLRAASWSPDGNWILTASEDATARVWRADSPDSETAVVLGGHDTAVWNAAWSPDGQWIVTTSGKVARIWRAGAGIGEQGSGEPVVLEHGEAVWQAAWSPDGQSIVTASSDRTARIWKPSAPEAEPVVLAGHEGTVRTATWSADGERVGTGSSDGTVRLWYLGGRGVDPRPFVLSRGEAGLADAVWSPDGRSIVTVAGNGRTRVWHVRDETGTVESGTAASPIVLEHGDTPAATRAAWSPDSQRLVLVKGKVLRVWRAGGGRPLDLEGHRDEIRTVVWSRGGERIVSASADGTARVWRHPGAWEGVGVEAVVLDHGPSTPVRAAAISPAGDRVVTGLVVGEVWVWPSDGRGEPIVLGEHDFVVTSVAWSPDGQWIATTSVDTTARVWRADGEAEPMVLEGHDGPIAMAAWNGDGDRLVTASADGTARVWRISTEGLIAHLRARTSLCLDEEFRVRILGDRPAEARRRHAACERAVRE